MYISPLEMTPTGMTDDLRSRAEQFLKGHEWRHGKLSDSWKQMIRDLLEALSRQQDIVRDLRRRIGSVITVESRRDGGPDQASMLRTLREWEQMAIQIGWPTPDLKGADTMTDAAEMLWVVLASVSGGDWTQQPAEWQEAAARWRDNYFAVLARAARPSPPSSSGRDMEPR